MTWQRFLMRSYAPGILFLIFIVGNTISLNAQIPVEVMVGHNQVQHEFFFFKDIDTSGKFDLFSTARFIVDYEESAFNASAINSQITYNFTESWGISTGGFFSDGDFSPLLALSYTFLNKKGDLVMNIFPTVLYNTSTKNIEYEMFGFLIYAPQINDQFSLFFQTIFGFTFNNDLSEHLSSYQQLRLGIGFRDWFQTGIGVDQYLFGADYIYANNIGVFIRKQL